jgi:iron uptake system EfeUOB component EfeO/EfeM
VLFTSLTPTDTQMLSRLIDALADPLSQVAAIVVSVE